MEPWMIGIFVMLAVFIIVLITIVVFVTTASKNKPTFPQALYYDNFVTSQTK